MIELIDVYASGAPTARTLQLLYDLLSERAPNESISHKRLPTMPDHIKFVDSRPYKEWWLICIGEDPVGAIYLSSHNEIGIGVLRRFRRKGYGQAAIREIMTRHAGERLLANINPENHQSIHIFKKFGFKHTQTTFEWTL